MEQYRLYLQGTFQNVDFLLFFTRGRTKKAPNACSSSQLDIIININKYRFSVFAVNRPYA
jgi:hypothetical protein